LLVVKHSFFLSFVTQNWLSLKEISTQGNSVKQLYAATYLNKDYVIYVVGTDYKMSQKL
jgi:hypothetical protein